MAGRNAYGTGLKQAVDFIAEEKDIKDLPSLDHFASQDALNNAARGIKGYAVGFSSIRTKTETIISGICRNADFANLLGYDEIILVAVNL